MSYFKTKKKELCEGIFGFLEVQVPTGELVNRNFNVTRIRIKVRGVGGSSYLKEKKGKGFNKLIASLQRHQLFSK